CGGTQKSPAVRRNPPRYAEIPRGTANSVGLRRAPKRFARVRSASPNFDAPRPFDAPRSFPSRLAVARVRGRHGACSGRVPRTVPHNRAEEPTFTDDLAPIPTTVSGCEPGGVTSSVTNTRCDAGGVTVAVTVSILAGRGILRLVAEGGAWPG